MTTITANSSIGITLSVSDSPVTVAANVTVADGTALSAAGGSSYYTYTIDNAGVILGGGSGHAGIMLGSYGTAVGNGAVTNEPGGSIAGDGYGIAIFGPGAVTNQANATIVSAYGSAIYLSGPAGNVVNYGTVNATGNGIYISSGSVTNAPNGKITGDHGVIISTTGTLINAGIVVGTNATSSGAAVAFLYADTSNRLIADPRGSFIGGVDGGTGVLELAVGDSSAGTLSGIGVSITNFHTLQFDPSAKWTAVGQAGSSGIDSLGISGFAANDTIEINNFVAISDTVTNGSLVLNDGTSLVSLGFLNGFSTSDFVVTNDGSSATFIVLQNVPASFTWTGGSADWTSAANWNPSGVPGAIDDATIDTTGTAYTVSIAAAEFADVNNLLLGASNATLEVDGTLAASGAVTVSGGALAVKGTLSATAITDAALITFIGDHTLSGTPLQLAGTLQVQDPDALTPSTLTLANDEVITQIGAAAVLTSGTVNGESIVNNGSISAAVTNGTLTIAPLNFTNNGTISVGAGETLTIGGTWTNQNGSIVLSPSVALTLGGAFTTGGIGVIDGAPGETITGSLNNTGAILNVGTGNQLGTVTLAHTAVIMGGTIIDNGSGFVFAAGTFDAVTFQGPLNLGSSNDRLNIANGLTMTGDGSINLTGGADTILNFINSQTIDNATINLNGTDSFNPLTEIDIQGALHSVLTFGSKLTVSSTASKATADIRNTFLSQTGVINLGTIIAAAKNGSFSITPNDGFANSGMISVSNTEILSIQPGFGIFNNSGTVTVSGGSTLQLIGLAPLTAPISNTGSIVLAGGTTLDLGGYYTEASLGNLSNQGTTKIEGTFDAATGTVALGSATPLNQVLLAGNLRNGTIVANGALTVAPGSASLLNLTYRGQLGISSLATTLTINEGVTVTDNAGAEPGTISVTGQNDTLALQNTELAPNKNQTLDNVTINIGNSAASDAINVILPAGTLSVGSGATIVSSATGALASFLAGTSSTVNFGGTLSATGKGGTFTVVGGGASKFSNNGLMLAGNGDTLSVTTAIMGGTGTIDISTGGIANFSTSVASGQTLAFTDATGTLRLHQPSSFAATVTGFTPGDTIDLANIAADSAAWFAGQLMVSNAGTTVATLALPDDYSGFEFAVASDGAGGSAVTVTATCYAAGTRILTTRGEVAIEHLREGDLVRTVSGGTQPIRWIGHRRVNFTRHPNRRRILPVRIAAHAFGEGRPKRDLLLSPDHAVFVEDVLIPIRHLINGSTISQVERRTITYYHIELPRHDVLLANGMPAESYLEAGAREAFANGGGVMQLHPDFSPPQDHYAMLWESHGYAPLVIAGEILERARRTLALQALMAA